MSVDLPRLRAAYRTARDLLLAECRSDNGGPAHWSGELSTSALSTATAVMALQMVRRGGRDGSDCGIDVEFDTLIRGGLDWLAAHQNDDGGWGDSVRSLSNISTTMLAHAVFHATGTADIRGFRDTVRRAKQYIDQAGGVPAVVARYGKDRTFSVPILTHCALAGLVDWREVTPLPFELSCVPARFYAAVRMPVVSYALPALIAIGQVRHHHRPVRNPVTGVLRRLAKRPSLRVLERVQPPNGGFLEAAPLTAFVTMSLAGMGLVDHVVVRRGAHFLAASVRSDGSWPIDTSLATWVTTLSVNALQEDVPESLRDGLVAWLLDQQYRSTHPYTNAAPGGWAWTNLPGGVPDADDTPGAVLALQQLNSPRSTRDAESRAIRWLLDLQNRDGGFPTFCRGWGTLPFDRSSADITAHSLRALTQWLAGPAPRPEQEPCGRDREHNRAEERLRQRCVAGIERGLRFLQTVQRADGAWLPLWFGNQYAEDDGNPVYGTSRVLMAYRDLGLADAPEAQRAAAWLASVQESPEAAQHDERPGAGGRDRAVNGGSTSSRDPRRTRLDPESSRGWGGDAGIAPSVEETALAAEALLACEAFREHAFAGIRWLIERVEDGTVAEPSPIGFYFARLWYFEALYPLIFAVSALRRALEIADTSAEA